MKSDFKDHIRQLLDRQEEDVLKALAELTGQRTRTRETVVPSSTVTPMSENDHVTRIVDHFRRRLKRIHAAQARLGTGRFGFCLRCGRRISESRLRVRPDALYCYECARAYEKRGAERRPRFEPRSVLLN